MTAPKTRILSVLHAWDSVLNDLHRKSVCPAVETVPEEIPVDFRSFGGLQSEEIVALI
jgi:hypothetical protein